MSLLPLHIQVCWTYWFAECFTFIYQWFSCAFIWDLTERTFLCPTCPVKSVLICEVTGANKTSHTLPGVPAQWNTGERCRFTVVSYFCDTFSVLQSWDPELILHQKPPHSNLSCISGPWKVWNSVEPFWITDLKGDLMLWYSLLRLQQTHFSSDPKSTVHNWNF